MSCLFCKIISKEIPAEIVYEDDEVLAFLDINPVNPGHTLVVPKKHCENLLEASEADLCNLISVIPKTARAIMASGQYEAFNVAMNNGAIAGQVINHLHFHIIPRKADDGCHLFKGAARSNDELKVDGEKIRKHLSNETMKQ
jgi:histidine triad (HIT) family protein